MKPFKLQSLLDYRKRLVDKANETLLACMEERSSLADARQAVSEQVNSLCAELEEAKNGSFSPAEMMLYEQCIKAKKHRIRELEEKIARADADIREKRQELVKARQKKRALEILKEKREAAERRKQDHQEKVFLDEIAGLGFGGGK